MSYESLEEFYSQLLGIETPWEVQEIIRDSKSREVHVTIAYDEVNSMVCPICGTPASMHDHKARKWQHLDSCNHKTIIEAEIPRVKCPVHGVHQITVPWAEKNSRFTVELERHVRVPEKAASD